MIETTIMINIIIFISLLICFGFVVYTLRMYVRDKYQTLFPGVINTNGWYELDWDKCKYQKNIENVRKTISKENVKFDEEVLKNIHYYDLNHILSKCSDIHKLLDKNEQHIANIKRCYTASGIYYKQKIPKALWLFDSQTIILLVMYTVYHETVLLDLDQYTDFKIQTQLDNTVFTNIIAAIPVGMKYVHKFNQGSSTPNIVRLFEILLMENKKLAQLLNMDIDNLKRLMTVCYCIAKLDIPKDYIFVDDNVYAYLKDPSNVRFMVRKDKLKLV